MKQRWLVEVRNRTPTALALDGFETSAWGQKHPTVFATWRRAWDRVVPFVAFAPEIRRVIYATNAIESPHSQLRKITMTRGHFPATNVIWLALRNITADWSRSVFECRQAMNQIAIAYGDRITQVSATKHHGGLEEPTPHMAKCQYPTGHPVRRTVYRERVKFNHGSHTKLLTRPVWAAQTASESLNETQSSEPREQQPCRSG